MSSTQTSQITPAVLYGAKSTQDRHRSIPTQLDDCREKATDEDWTVAPGDEYSDEGFSAYSGNRGDGLAQAKARAVELATVHGRCMLIAQAADRFARGSGDQPGAADALVEIWHQLRRQGVELRSVEDDFDLRDSASVANLGQRAHMDSRRKSKSVKKGMKRRRADGKHSGGPRKFGYDYARDPSGRTYPDEPLRVVPAEAAVVRRIYRDYVAGHTQRAIERALNAEGVRTTRGCRWYQGTIAHVLADPFYAGLIKDGAELIPGEHEAIVDHDLWRQAEQVRIAGTRTLNPGGRPPKRPYLFTNGYLRCGRCGSAMIPRTSQRKSSKTGKPWGKVYEVYRCHARISDVTSCDQPPVSRAAVDDAALRTLEARGVDVEQTRTQMLASLAAERSDVQARLDDARRQERKATEALERLDRDYASGELGAANFERLQPRLQDEHDGARAAREQVERRLGQLSDEQIDDALAATVAGIREAIAAHLADDASIDEVRLLLRRLFDRFVLRELNDGLVLIPELRPDALAHLTGQAPGGGGAPLLITALDGKPTYAVIGAIPLPAPEPRTSKPCTKCGRELPFEAFNADPRVRDGRRADCRDCQRAARRARDAGREATP